MPQAKGANSYPSARNLLDRAVDSEKGIKLPFENPKKAFSMRMNCYTVRSRQRIQNERIYDSDHPLCGNTPWDHLELTLEAPRGSEERTVLVITNGMNTGIETLIEEIE